jgi:hypothetical protein
MTETLEIQIAPCDAPRRCVFKITDDALIVGNTGRPFSRLGVISICSAHLSEKGRVTPVDIYNRDADLVDAIADKGLRVYQEDPNRMLEDSGSEHELQRDYEGRSAWELLQKADDANASADSTSSELIGAKGIGFKSVLEITDEPEIHSDRFHFQFSPEKTRERLRSSANDPPSLSFRIPHRVAPSSDITRLLDDYTTIIRLPFRDAKARDKAFRSLEDWMPPGGATILLLCQHITEITLDLGNRPVTWRVINRPPPFADGEISIKCSGYDDRAPFAFRRWAHSQMPASGSKKLSVAAVLRLDSGQRPEPFERPVPLHVFFPTKEALPIHALIHASLDLEHNRKRVRESEHDDAVLDHLAAVITRLVREVPAQVALRGLMPSSAALLDGLALEVQERIINVLKTSEFVPCIGGVKRSVAAVRLYDRPHFGAVLDPNAPELAKEALVEPDLISDKVCRHALKQLSASELTQQDYPKLLRFCRNKTSAECRDSASELISVVDRCGPPTYPAEYRAVFREACCHVPCWWTDKGVARDLLRGPPLLRPPLTEELPSWISVDLLANEHEESLKSIERNRSVRQSKDDLWQGICAEHLLPPTDETLLARVLVSALLDKTSQDWWHAHGKSSACLRSGMGARGRLKTSLRCL